MLDEIGIWDLVFRILKIYAVNHKEPRTNSVSDPTS